MLSADEGNLDTEFVFPLSEAVVKVPSEPRPAAASEPPFPLADAGPYYVGMWNGIPNYGCPYCVYATIAHSPEAGTGAVELHILAKIDQGSKSHLKALELQKGELA